LVGRCATGHQQRREIIGIVAAKLIGPPTKRQRTS